MLHRTAEDDARARACFAEWNVTPSPATEAGLAWTFARARDGGRADAQRELDEARALVAALRQHLLCRDVEEKSIGVDGFDPRLHCSACRTRAAVEAEDDLEDEDGNRLCGICHSEYHGRSSCPHDPSLDHHVAFPD